MNLYKINYGYGANASYAFVTEATEGKAIRQFRKAYNGQEFSSIELVRENASATKEQERKAVEQIRAIIATLGPDSYTATALEGCLEDAESNIENDFGDSYKTRFENAKNEIERLKEKLEESVKDYEAAHEAAHQIAAEKDAVIASLQAQVEALQKQVLSEDDLLDIKTSIEKIAADWERDAKDAANLIVEYADTPAAKVFTDAVKAHREAQAVAKNYRDLAARIETARAANLAGAQ